MYYAKQSKLIASTCLFVSYNCEGEYSSAFCKGNDIVRGSNRGCEWRWVGVMGGLNVGA